ncbi:O-antigen ligase family protein [Synechococcus sp. MIT S9452]|uniref:O-antigen ligase family protein n=1 Tax=Synechococcus sp. MIT S9452 TaxID=3082546 RepID=UPI0039A5C57C
MSVSPFFLTWFVTPIDFLLPVSITLFLLPGLDPGLSTIPVFIWLFINFQISKQSQRFFALPLIFALLFSAHSLFVNSAPHPVSITDALLFAVALGSSAFVNTHRWKRIFILLPLSLLPSLSLVTSRPWIPNELAGVNQNAYLIGLASLAAFSLLFFIPKSHFLCGIAVVFLLISCSLLWMTGSRAALVSVIVSMYAGLFNKFGFRSRVVRFFTIGGALALLILLTRTLYLYFNYPPDASPFFGSELGRLEALKCFLKLPFSNEGNLVYGSGFESLKELCSSPVKILSSSPDHAHNLYVQVWAGSGLMGLIALGSLAYIMCSTYRALPKSANSLIDSTWIMFLFYVGISGIFDLSYAHWPVTVFWSGLFLGMPFSGSFSKRLVDG